MHVLRRKKFPATLLEPTFASARLTLRAVPISTRVVGDGAMSAARALIEMSAEHGRATPRNGQQHFDMLPGDPPTASFVSCENPPFEAGYGFVSPSSLASWASSILTGRSLGRVQFLKRWGTTPARPSVFA